MPTNIAQLALKTLAEIFFPYQSLFRPINSILNTSPGKDGKDLDDAVNKWKDTTLYELNFIGIVAALLSSLVTSCLAWPVTLPWTVRALWLTSLLFGVMSLSLAAQQAIALTRVSNSESSTHKIQHLLGEPLSPKPSHHPSPKAPSPSNVESAEPVKWRPLKLQLYVWQIPSMLLGWSVMIFVTGLAIWVFATAKAALGWGDEKRIAVFFGCFMAFVAGNYMLSWICIERRVQVGISRQ